MYTNTNGGDRSSRNDTFCISEYLHLLTKNPNKKGAYICPVCNGNDLCINGDKYTCYSNHCDTKKITVEVLKLAGKIPDSGFNSNSSQDYSPSKKGKSKKDSSEIIKITDNVSGLNFIKQTIGEHLALNTRRQIIEYKGQELDLNFAAFVIAEHFGIHISEKIVIGAIAKIAADNAYDPVMQYLEKCTLQPHRVDLNTLAQRYFGTTNPIYDLFLKRTLIGAVARVFVPGAKMDTALILQGTQGIGKSSFFKVLGGEWYDDSMGEGKETDNLMILHTCWIQEWSELDRIMTGKYYGSIKATLSKSHDRFRPPYGRVVVGHPRASIIVGTTNEPQFLHDPTGSRRFWVTPVEKKIDLELLTQERDAIWATAVEAYSQGERWWLEGDEQTVVNNLNKAYEVEDPLEEPILEYLEGKETTFFQTRDILNWLESQGYKVNGTSKQDQKRVTDILKRHGWQKKLTRIDGKPVKGWWRY